MTNDVGHEIMKHLHLYNFAQELQKTIFQLAILNVHDLIASNGLKHLSVS